MLHSYQLSRFWHSYLKIFDIQLATVGFSEQKSQSLLPITHTSISIDAMFDIQLATEGFSEQKSQSLLPITHTSISIYAMFDIQLATEGFSEQKSQHLLPLYIFPAL